MTGLSDEQAAKVRGDLMLALMSGGFTGKSGEIRALVMPVVDKAVEAARTEWGVVCDEWETQYNLAMARLVRAEAAVPALVARIEAVLTSERFTYSDQYSQPAISAAAATAIRAALLPDAEHREDCPAHPRFGGIAPYCRCAILAQINPDADAEPEYEWGVTIADEPVRSLHEAGARRVASWPDDSGRPRRLMRRILGPWAEVSQALPVAAPHPHWPCPTTDCPGDGRYAPPGRGHREGCTGPVTAPDTNAEVRRCPNLDCNLPIDPEGQEGRYCGVCEDHEGHCPEDHCATCGAST